MVENRSYQAVMENPIGESDDDALRRDFDCNAVCEMSLLLTTIHGADRQSMFNDLPSPPCVSVVARPHPVVRTGASASSVRLLHERLLRMRHYPTMEMYLSH